MSELNIKDLMVSVVDLLLSREGDVDTEGGSFATCGTDEIIRLDCAVANFLKLPSDDVNYDDIDLIRHNIKSLGTPQSELVSVELAELREFRRLAFEAHPNIDVDIDYIKYVPKC